MKDNIAPFKVFIPKSAGKALIKTLLSGYIGQGPKVDLFESELKEKFGLDNIVTVNSGTSALRLALSLAGVGPGDEVISTPYTMVATNTAILEQFAKPVFADIKYDSININPNDIEHRITDKTKAIMCVHWSGYPCDMDEIHKIAIEHDLPVIEDAAHALGAKYKNRAIGTISEYTAFSFQAIKHLTTGDGGMITIPDNAKYAEAMRRRWFGIDRANRKETMGDPVEDIKEVGYKYHMNDLAATIGLEQLKYFDSLFGKRTEIANRYREGLADINGIELLENRHDRTHGNWMFAVHARGRNRLIKRLKSRGIGAYVHNWRNDRYSVFGGIRNDLPVLDRVEKDLTNLPIHHDVSNEDVDYIISEVKSCMGDTS